LISIGYSASEMCSSKQLSDKLRELGHKTSEQKRSQSDLFAKGVELVHAFAYPLEFSFAGHQFYLP
jgi:hypothetical protein